MKARIILTALALSAAACSPLVRSATPDFVMLERDPMVFSAEDTRSQAQEACAAHGKSAQFVSDQPVNPALAAISARTTTWECVQ